MTADAPERQTLTDVVAIRTPSGWHAAVPSAIVVAVITLAGIIIQRCQPPTDAAQELRADVKALRTEVSGIREQEVQLLQRVNDIDDNTKNAKLIDALQHGHPQNP